MVFVVEGDRCLRPSEESWRRGLNREDRPFLDLRGPPVASSLVARNDHETTLLVQECALGIAVAVFDVLRIRLSSVFLLCILEIFVQ